MNKSRQAGMTLVEILIFLAVSAVILVLLLGVIINSTGLFYKETSKLQGGLNSNDALAEVRGNIKESNGIAASYTDGAVVYTTNDTQLVLKKPSLDSSDNIITDTFDYYVVFLDQTKLRFKSFPNNLSTRPAVDRIFSTNAEMLKIQYFNSAQPPLEVSPTSASKVKITLTLKQKNGQTFETTIATSEANLRND